MNILQINGSARAEGAQSTRLADAISARLRALQPDAGLVVRDLARQPHPMLDAAALSALMTSPAQRSPEQQQRVALDDALVAELQAADLLVLGVPTYNFGISVQLKCWFDAVSRAGVTFRYTENGPEGLLTGKRAIVALARGGRYRDTASDSQVPYLKTMLGFLGVAPLEFIYAEGLNMGAGIAEPAWAEAMAQVAQCSL